MVSGLATFGTSDAFEIGVPQLLQNVQLESTSLPQDVQYIVFSFLVIQVTPERYSQYTLKVVFCKP